MVVSAIPSGCTKELPASYIIYIHFYCCYCYYYCCCCCCCCLFRKNLNKGPLLYIHLNLSVALLVMLVVFLLTVQLAQPITVSTEHAQ